ncbi:MAG: TIGR00266 family protein [Alcanivorax sediminis]|uniref:TIGR00266 family protein n=1 Tax=Alcanivorax sediminis TaxID=2663008 RepID=UPI003C484471
MNETVNIRIHHDFDETALQQAISGFAALFKTEEEKASKVLRSAPVVIRKNVSPDVAEKFRAALQNLGIGVTFEQSASQPVAEPAPAPAPVNEAPVAANPPGEAPVADTAVIESDKDHPGYAFRIEGRPDFSFLTVTVPANQMIKVEASAMATMDTHLEMKTRMRGGLGRLMTGESIFINEFTSPGGPGEIGIAPAAPGDMGHVYLNEDTIYLQNSAFVASGPEVAVESKWQGLTKGFFSGESLFLIRAQGTGDLWFNTYGAMIEIDVKGDYVVDTGNIVAFTEGLEYKVSKVGGYKSLFFSGEGFVCRFSGEGKVWIQTRGVDAFLSWLHPYRPVPKRG